jgi:hypothetical protein
MRGRASLAERLNGFCARLNEGLSRVAILLALVTAGWSLEQRLPALRRLFDPAAAGFGTMPF